MSGRCPRRRVLWCVKVLVLMIEGPSQDIVLLDCSLELYETHSWYIYIEIRDET